MCTRHSNPGDCWNLPGITTAMDDLSSKFAVSSDMGASFEDWVKGLPCELAPEGEHRLRRAWDLARSVYSGQRHESGADCFEHALSLATLLAGLNLDVDTIIAGLLLQRPFREAFEPAQRVSEVGDTVAGLLEEAWRVDVIGELHETPGKKDAGHAEALRKMILALARDIRVVFIVLAERVIELREWKHRPKSLQQPMARQTLELYAPLANRLGIWQLKWELEDLSLRILQPEDYQRIARLLAEKRVDREHYVQALRERVSLALQQAGIEAQVTGRPKHIYSIWRKMQLKGLGFHDLSDLRAIRVLVNTVAECYAALGVIHALWQPISREYDDYIITPKENRYQSLHTAVTGPQGKSVEVQIRTRWMHGQAELGIAAHWRYKEGSRRDPDFDDKVAWLRQLLQWAQQEASAYEPLERYKAEVFDDRVYVLTPRADVLDLPRGATPLDFAYQIHTQIGHRCRGAKVNSRIVPLTQPLQNADRVEILTARNPAPSRDWLNTSQGYLRTARARAQVRSWFRQQDFARNVADGRNLLEREMRRRRTRPVNLEKLAQISGFPKPDELLAAIGRGDVSPGLIVGNLSGGEPAEEPKPAPAPVRRGNLPDGECSDAIVIHGVGNVLTRLAKCCRPIAGDAIIGFITRGRGVSVHRRACPNVSQLMQRAGERLIETSWGYSANQRYPVDIQIETNDPPGLLRELPALLGSEQITLKDVPARIEPGDSPVLMTLVLEIRDVGQMNRLMNRIAALRRVHGVRRVVRA